MYEGTRVAEREWGKERKDAKNVGYEDVKWTHFYTDTFTQRRSYADTLLHAFTHRGVYTQTLLHTEVLTHRRLDTTKLAQSTGNVLPSATSYCKACTSTSRYYSFAQNTSPYYFVLQRLHTVLPSTTLYKCTTKLAQRCTKYFPVLLCTTKLAQSTSLRSGHPPSSYTQTTDAFTQETPLHTNAFTRRHFSTHFYAQKACRKYILYCFVLQSIKAYTGGERKLKLCCQNAPRDKKNAEENLGLCWRNARNKTNRDENHIMLVKRAAGEEFWEENLTLCWQDRHQGTLDAPKITIFLSFWQLNHISS